jgi:hypothetical protein
MSKIDKLTEETLLIVTDLGMAITDEIITKALIQKPGMTLREFKTLLDQQRVSMRTQVNAKIQQ